MVSSLHHSVPSECSTYIFSFLGMRDCLTFGGVSKGAMADVFATLQNRRQKMKETFAYSRSQGATDRPHIVMLHDVSVQASPREWSTFPSVEERACKLHRSLPVGHPSREKVRDLCEDLALPFDHFEKQNTSTCFSQSTEFTALFSFFQRLTRAARLHAEIVKSGIYSQSFGRENNTLLDHYVGDVLCVTYFINDSNLGIVDGSPSSETFLKELCRQISGSTCYRSWVYIHSSILLRKQFSPQQRQILNIPDFCGVSDFIPMERRLSEFFMCSELRIVFREFGPLGPAFRGRDTVRFRDIPASVLVGFLGENSGVDPIEDVGVLEWLSTVHEQARKSRPMTVRAPVVRLSAPLR